MADAIAGTTPILASALTEDHVGRFMVLDSQWGRRAAEIKAVRQDELGAAITVSLRPYADRGPIPVMAHRKPGIEVLLVDQDVVDVW